MIVVMDPPPIRQIGWREDGNYTRDPRRLPAPADNPWRPCPTCWGQGRVYSSLPKFWSQGEPKSEACPTCIGVGSIPSTGRTR